MIKKIFLTIIVLTLSVVCAFAADGKFVLVIDAGHGGNDPGALGSVAKEKNINLSVALAFGKYVEKNCPDVKVIYTRTTDVFVPLQERAQIANRNKADLFISIHTNALDGGKISRGMETYTLGMHRAADNLNVAKRENSVILIEKNYKQTYAGFDPKSSESYIMFELMQDKNMSKSVELARLIQSETCSYAGRVNKGVHQAGFLVLRETSMPSCLVELGFITTSDEEAFLNTSDGQDKMAKGIFNAFVKYKNKHGKSTTPPSQSTPAKPANPPKQNNPAKPAKTSKPRADVNPQSSGDVMLAESNKVQEEQDENLPFWGNESAVVVEDTMLMASVEYAEPQRVRTNVVASKAPVSSSNTNSVAQQPPQTAPPQPTPQPEVKPTPQPEVKPTPQPEAKPTPQPEAKPTPQPEVKPTPQPEVKPTPQPEVKPTPQPEVKPTPQPEVKPTPQPEVKPTPQPEAKPTPQPEAKPTPQPEVKPTPQPEVKPTPQPEAKPTPQPETEPNPRPEVASQSQQTDEVGGRPIFKVQIVATSQQVPVDAPQFLDVKDISFYTENDMYKYTVGASPDFNEISELKKQLQTKFPQAFIIAFRDGNKVDTGEAIREYKKNKQNK